MWHGLRPGALGSRLFLLQLMLSHLFLSPHYHSPLNMHSSLTCASLFSTVCPAGWTPGSDTIKPNVDDSKEYFSKHN